MMRRRGSVLIMTLVLIALVAMYTTALVATNQRLFGMSRRSEDLTAALALGQGGLNRLIQQLTFDSNFSSDLTYGNPQTGYQITFNPGSPTRSVNNLNNASASAATNYRGQTVPPYTADVIVVAQSSGVTRRLRYVLTRGLAYRGAMGANGKIEFGADASLRSYTSLTDHTPVACQFHANDSDNTGMGILWAGPPSTFSIGNQCEVTSASGLDGAIEAANPGKTQSNVPKVPIPQVDVATMVSMASSSPAPTTLATGGIYCDTQTYLAGNQTIDGDINLQDGSLFVDGDLTINGGLLGFGSVYVTGDIHIVGGNATVITNQPNGAAVLAGGDIVFEGADATGYLETLAALHPATVGVTWTQAKNVINVLDQITVQPPASYARPGGFTGLVGSVDAWLTVPAFTAFPQLVDVWWVKYRLGNATALGGNTEAMRIPNPDGTFAVWNDAAMLRQVRDAVEALPTYSSDPRAQQITHALDQMGYFYRHTWNGAWHEGSMGDPYFNLDHQLWTVRGMVDPGGSPYTGFWFSGDPIVDQAKTNQYVQNYIELNPSLPALGRAYFQGVLYANGSVSVANDAAVIGSIVSGGDLTIAGEANFIYNKEYDALTNSIVGPVKVASFNEL